MLNRRQFIGSGLAAFAIGLAARRAAAASSSLLPGSWQFPPPSPGGPGPWDPDDGARRPCFDSGASFLDAAHPIVPVSSAAGIVNIAGLPVVNQWFGDDFASSTVIPFHSGEANYPNGIPPEVGESHDVVIIGGGLSGLATAYHLRHRRPVVLELHSRFGGVSAGEIWNGSPFSLGSAYFIKPDAGSSLASLYHQLGVHRLKKESPASDDPIELGGAIAEGFWSGAGMTPLEQQGFAEYAALVQHYGENYPEIPLIDGADNLWIRRLDQLTLREHITQSLTVPAPRLLQAAIQGYCYSSFNASWDEISAASGWNFIAAEEFGRWILPGGNAGLASLLFERVRDHLERHTPRRCPPRYLRASCRAVEVRVLGPDNVKVIYRGADGEFRAIRAKRVVLACPKHVARRLPVGFATSDPQRFSDTYEVQTNGYVVANVLLHRAAARRYYDMFQLDNGKFPDIDGQTITPQEFSRVTDTVCGTFNPRHGPNGVLTMYWPLPYATSRFELIAEGSVAVFAERLRSELDITLGALDLTVDDVAQVRMSRWGHSMPIARPGLISSGLLERLRQPLQDHIFFVNCDNWCLPAVETCLLEAEYWAPEIERGL